VRTNKIFVDWSQNDQHKTTISVYSLRARENPTVSTPVRWEEVEQALKKKDASRLVFEAKDVLARVEKMGDLFEPVQTLKQKLPQLAGLTEPASAESPTTADSPAKPPSKKSGKTISSATRAVPAPTASKTSGKKTSARNTKAAKRRKI